MAIKKVLHQAMADEAFRERLRSAPHKTLSEYDLSEEEVEAIASRRESKVAEMTGDISSDGLAKSPGYVVDY